MKKIKLLCILCFTIVTTVEAQQKLDCDYNFREALFYLKGDENFKRDSLKSIEFLKPCLKVGDAKAQLLMGRLYVAKKEEDSYRKAFKLIKKSAKQGNAIAAGDLGVLYKYGHGCNLNLNKARKWFKKGAELGNDKATYSLGYLYLKGFGNIEQDYSKAVKWFKKSDYPMANYWLGVCYYYGYGVQKNSQKANQLLGTNFTNAASNTENTATTENTTSVIAGQLEENSEDSSVLEDITEEELFGKWSGFLLKFDWSGNYIEQKHSLRIEFTYDSINEVPRHIVEIEEQKLIGSHTKADNVVYFDDLFIHLPHTSFNKKIPNKLEYQLLSSDVLMKKLDAENYLIGTIENHIEAWNESGAPLRFVLKKKETFSNSNEELTDDVLKALSEQKDSFIKLYPNPFESDLIISYTLETPTKTPHL
ncbi:MAG: tetratricopeptide repeat protein [Polaribacter sp.]|nr:tetratricopeptide repeat protein [Polaribacter sp.]